MEFKALMFIPQHKPMDWMMSARPLRADWICTSSAC